MKRITGSASVLFFLFMGLSCEKGDLPFVPCSIKQVITYQPGYMGAINKVVNNFTYTSWGAPLKIVTSSPGTGNPHYEFKYDKKKRLIQLLTYFSEWNQFTTTIFVYGENGLISSDTAFLTNAPFIRGISDYFYDSKLRISKVVLTTGGGPVILEYKYDERGNLVRGDQVVYDNKVNLHRTNPVWMFIDRDYSMNNPLPANIEYSVTYNRRGLLTSFTTVTPTQYGPRILTHPVNEVVYNCDDKGRNY